MLLRLLPAVVVGGLVSVLAAPQQTAGFDPAALTRSVRPQDDFYLHVNTAWHAAAPMPADRVNYGSFAEASDRVDERVLDLVKAAQADTRRRPGSLHQQMVDLYASVTDEAAINARGVGPMRETLARIDAVRTTAGLAAEAGHLSALAAGGPFAGTPVPDPDDPRQLTVQIAQGGTLLPERDLYFRSDGYAVDVRARYVEYLATLFRLLGREEPEDEARAVLALETELARVQWTSADSRDPVKTANRYTFRQLAREMPGFDWEAWGRPQGLTASGAVVLAQPSFFEAFAALVPAVPLETWKAWLRARYVTAVSPYVSDPFSDARFEFFGRFLTGQEAPRPRWRRGVAMVSAFLADAIGRLYVQRHFPQSSRARVETIAGTVRTAFREALSEAAWLSPQARREAVHKIGRLQIRIGHPEAWRDYRSFIARPDDLLGNIQRAQLLEHRQQLARTLGREDARYWPVPAQSVNAVFSASASEILIPAGMLQPPFFDPDADDAVNYGSIGGVIGHELSHAFDARGRYFDGNGVQRNWWTPADEEAFLTIAVRLIEQAEKWPLASGAADMKIDGTFTFAENAADLAGLSVAWRAYRRSLGNNPAPVIAGLTGDQRFFIGWAQAWRTKVRPEYMRQTLLTDPHAPADFRVNGIVQHLDAFHDAFGVQEGDRLYRAPGARLKIW